jgi:murein L,D-transpeptidase YafK
MRLRPALLILAILLLGVIWLRLKSAGLTGKMTPPQTGEHIIILKAERKLDFYRGGKLLHSYHIGLGPVPIGAKLRSGDGRTPEGEYYICSKNPKSSYYLSLGLSYPNAKDAARGLKAKLINQKQHDQIAEAIKHRRRPPWDTPLGGEIFIHGNGAKTDWTLGCIALEDADIKALYQIAPVGTPVTILPQEKPPKRTK